MAEKLGHVTDVVEPELALDGVLAELDDKVPKRASQSLTLLISLVGQSALRPTPDSSRRCWETTM